MTKKAYLAQGIEGRSTLEISGSMTWMRDLIEEAGFSPIAPYLTDDANGESSGLEWRSVVSRDISLLRDADLIVVDLGDAAHEYIGCIAELVYARLLRIPSFVYIGQSGRGSRKWLTFHSDYVFNDLDALRSFFATRHATHSIASSLPGYYDARASSYDDAYESIGKHDDPSTNIQWSMELSRARDVMMPHLKGKVLDLACGTGWWRSRMEYADHVVCADISEQMLAIARGRSTSGTSFVKCDALKPLPFEDSQFDSCFLGFWVGLLDPFTIKAQLEEVSRVVKPDGTIVVFDTLKERVEQRYEYGEWNIQYRGEARTSFFKRYYRAEELAHLLAPFSTRLSTRETGRFFTHAIYGNLKRPVLVT